MNFKKKYASILHLIPKRSKNGRPTKDEMAERIKIADALLKQYKSGGLTMDIVPTVDTPEVVTPIEEETEESVVNRMKTKFDNINEYAHGVVSGAIRGMVVSGPGGTGKTETMVRIYEAAAEEKKIRFMHVKGGKVTAINVYKILYEYRNENDVLLFDDIDDIWESQDALNLLKAALDSSVRRRLSWASEAATLRTNEIPASFDYNGSISFITNRPLLDEIEKGRGKNVDHLEAFTTRCPFISIRFKNVRDAYIWAEYMTKANFILRQLGVTDTQAEEIYAFARATYTQWRSVSIRSFNIIARTYKMSPNRWRELAIEAMATT